MWLGPFFLVLCVRAGFQSLVPRRRAAERSPWAEAGRVRGLGVGAGEEHRPRSHAARRWEVDPGLTALLWALRVGWASLPEWECLVSPSLLPAP